MGGAGWAGGGGVALVLADEEVVFEVGHGDLMRWLWDAIPSAHDGLGSERIGVYAIGRFSDS